MRKFLQLIGFCVVLPTLIMAGALVICWIYLFGFTVPHIGH